MAFFGLATIHKSPDVYYSLLFLLKSLEPVSKPVVSEKAVIPAKAGIRNILKTLDSRLHGNDKKRANDKNY